MTKISILTPCYNHEKYILQFLEGIKAQTFTDFEVIIVDDYSTDNTVKIIEQFNDNRIKLIKHEYNKGLNSAINTAFKHSDSPLCILLASDDILKPYTLEYIVKEFEKNPTINVIYGNLTATDKNGKSLHKTIKPKLKNKFEILKKIFYSSNPLLSPAMSFRKTAFEKIYPLEPSIINHQDTLMHVKLLLNNEILVIDKELANYRLPNADSGISIRSNATNNRENLEINSILNIFLNIKDTDLLLKIFGKDIEKYGKPTIEVIPYFLARLALDSNENTRKIWGYYTLTNFLAIQENFNLIHKLYEFNYKSFLDLINVFNETEEIKLNKKIKKYKKLFNTTLLISILIFLIMFFFIIK